MLAAHCPMSNPRKKKVFTRLYLAYGIGALLTYVLLMVFIMPWWHVGNHPVLVTMETDPEHPVSLAFDGSDSILPLIPLDGSEQAQRSWITELPPRPHYQLSLVFPEGSSGEVILSKLEVVRLSPKENRVSLDFLDMAATESEGIQLTRLPSGLRVFAEPGSRLPLDFPMPTPNPFQWLKAWTQATIGFVVFSLVLFLTLSTGSLFPDRVLAYRRRTPAWEILVLLVFVLVGSMAHLHLVQHSMPDFAPGESDLYLRQAMAQPGEATTLRPGYPFLLDLTAGRLGWDMGEVTTLQAGLFCFSLAMLGLSMVRLVRSFVLGPVLILAALSPPALWASRHIGAESVTTSTWLLSLAAFLFLWKREKWLRWLGILLFGLILSAANLVSSSAILLLALPAGLLFGTLIWTVVIRGVAFWKLGVFWATIAQVMIPVAMVFMTCLGVSSTPGSCGVEAHGSSASLSSGMLELQPLVGSPAYANVLRERASNGFSHDGPAMKGVPDLAERSAESLPVKARFVAWGRLSLWGLFLPDRIAGTAQSIRTDYRLHHRFPNSGAAGDVQQSLTALMRDTGQLVHVPERHSNRTLVLYNGTFIGVYGWFYRILLVAALVGWVFGLLDRKLSAAILVLPYMLNILMQVYSLSISSEGIQSMDALLWVGALAGLLCANPKALQRPTDESDRRTMRPIRPKRLFRRHSDLSTVNAD